MIKMLFRIFGACLFGIGAAMLIAAIWSLYGGEPETALQFMGLGIILGLLFISVGIHLCMPRDNKVGFHPKTPAKKQA